MSHSAPHLFARTGLVREDLEPPAEHRYTRKRGPSLPAEALLGALQRQGTNLATESRRKSPGLKLRKLTLNPRIAITLYNSAQEMPPPSDFFHYLLHSGMEYSSRVVSKTWPYPCVQ